VSIFYWKEEERGNDEGIDGKSVRVKEREKGNAIIIIIMWIVGFVL